MKYRCKWLTKHSYKLENHPVYPDGIYKTDNNGITWEFQGEKTYYKIIIQKSKSFWDIFTKMWRSI